MTDRPWWRSPYRDDGHAYITAALLVLCAGAMLWFAPAACTSPSSTVSAAEALGFTDVQPGGYAWFGCGEGDHIATKFTATGADGHPVSGVVCCGAFKACTVRFR